MTTTWQVMVIQKKYVLVQMLQWMDLHFPDLMRKHHPQVNVELAFVQGGHSGDQGELSWTKDASKMAEFLIRHT